MSVSFKFYKGVQMFKIILLLGSVIASNAFACNAQQALDAVKIELNATAKAMGAKSVVVSSETADMKNADFKTYLFRLEMNSGTGGPLGMIGFDSKKCEVMGTLLLPIADKFLVN